MSVPESSCFEAFLACERAAVRGELIRRVSERDKEFHFQDWFASRLKEANIRFDGSGRNTYPDFPLVNYTEAYEIKGLAWPGRDADYDANSQLPSGHHNGRDLYYVFGRYPKEPDGNQYPLIDLVICHGDFLNTDQGYVHKNCRHAFSHHVLRPRRTSLEANVWGTPKSSGSFSTLFETRLLRAKRYCRQPFEVKPHGPASLGGAKVLLPGVEIAARFSASFAGLQRDQANALIHCGDSAHAPLPDESVDLVVTDPPYFDNVNYSELADFFHAWLQPALAGSDPVFHVDTTRHPREVQTQDAGRFGELLGDVFKESVRVLKPNGLLVFTFHHSKPEAWDGIAHALSRARLTVLALHFMKAEMLGAAPKRQATDPINIDCILVTAPVGSRWDSRHSGAILENSARSARLLSESGLHLSLGDLRVIIAGHTVQLASCDGGLLVDVTKTLNDLWPLAGSIILPEPEVHSMHAHFQHGLPFLD